MTQQQLADKLSVSAKTISKWETAKGYPDITLLESIANALSVSVTELISGNTIVNSNVSANMLVGARLDKHNLIDKLIFSPRINFISAAPTNAGKRYGDWLQDLLNAFA